MCASENVPNRGDKMLARCSERPRDIPLVCEIMGLKDSGTLWSFGKR